MTATVIGGGQNLDQLKPRSRQLPMIILLRCRRHYHHLKPLELVLLPAHGRRRLQSFAGVSRSATLSVRGIYQPGVSSSGQHTRVLPVVFGRAHHHLSPVAMPTSPSRKSKAAASSSPSPKKKHAKMVKRLVLHFDLNRTILMSDASGGRSMEDTVNYLLTEICWGRVVAEDDGPKVQALLSHLLFVGMPTAANAC